MQIDFRHSTEMPQRGWRVAYSAIQVRFRFVMAIVALAIIAGVWPWLTNAWERVLARLTPYVLDTSVSSSKEYFCPMDPGVVSVWPAICPICNMDLISRLKSESQILPSGVIARMQFSPYRVSLAGVRTVEVNKREPELPNMVAANQDLLVPTTAVVHWGSESIVYVESMPGMFDGIPIQLGRREGDSYIVQAGLKAGQRVVAVGTLLVDAESRLHPHLSTQYFGATAETTAAPPATIQRSVPSPSMQLEPAELELIETQRYCPVTKAKLGSMGAPEFVAIGDRRVAICCAGCRKRLLAEPTKYLAWLDQQLPNEREPK